MHFTDLTRFLATGTQNLADGPVALIFAEDRVAIEATVSHHLGLGFASVLLFMPADFNLDPETAKKVVRVDLDTAAEDALESTVTAVSNKMPGRWLFYCYNAEFLFFPFCETRNIVEMIRFHEQERRSAMLSYVVDLYAEDLGKYPNAVNLDQAYIDKVGYYALTREDPEKNYAPKERQLNFFGGLRWRFEEHVDYERRKIDRIALFQAKRGLTLAADYTFNDQEYNTYACPWHNNLTTVTASFRTAKALKHNPGSNQAIQSFMWRNSTEFQWSSRHLMDLGLMEPGQWF